MKIIDAHAHVGEGQYYKVSVSNLLSDMDELEMEKAFICPGECEIASNPCAGNKRLMKIKEKYPSRFFLWAAANPWEKKKAIKTLKDARDMGFDGLKLNSYLNGYRISDDIVTPLIEVVQEYTWPVYVHTGTPITSEPMQLVSLAEDFPKVKFIMGHTAFADFWYDVVPCMKRCANIYAETSIVGPGTIKSVISAIGYDRLLFGSDFPNGNIEVELEKVNSIGLSKENLKKVLAKNIERLLKI